MKDQIKLNNYFNKQILKSNNKKLTQLILKSNNKKITLNNLKNKKL